MKSKSTKKLLLLFIIVSVLVLLVATNPSKDEYDSWAVRNVSNLSSNDFAKTAINLIGRPVIDQFTYSKNYVIFSVYDTNYKGIGITTVGILNNFIVVKQLSLNLDS